MQYCSSAVLLLRAAQHEWHMGECHVERSAQRGSLGQCHLRKSHLDAFYTSVGIDDLSTIPLVKKEKNRVEFALEEKSRQSTEQ
jgi:hypothetical protein